MKNKKVFVSGCFDLLHPGHIEFLNKAATFGDLYVSIGSDNTILELKDHSTYYSEQERLLMVSSLRCVHEAFIAAGSGKLDFIAELYKIKPDIFIVNEDGDCLEKRELCIKLSIDYIVLDRYTNMISKQYSSTEIKNNLAPYRVELAGGWLDARLCDAPGRVITLQIEPTYNFNIRSGMASSTRNQLIKYFPNSIDMPQEQLAKVLYSIENGPLVSGSAGAQDAIGLCYSGIVSQYYDSNIWPSKIEHAYNYSFLEEHVCLIESPERDSKYTPYLNSNINEYDFHSLAIAAEQCWDSILDEDTHKLANSINNTWLAQIAMFPNMSTGYIETIRDKYKDILAYKFTGAGGGGYIIGIFNNIPENTIRLKIKR